MKRKFLPIFASALFMISLSSCVKQVDDVPTTPATAENFAELNVSSTFNWSTTRKVNFDFNGVTGQEYELVLKVIDADGNILFQKLQKANESYKVALEIPAHLETVTIAFGSTTGTYDCKNGSVSMNLN